MLFESLDSLVTRYPDLSIRTVLTGRGARAYLPLVVAGKVAGTLVFVFAEHRVFSQEDKTFMTALAGQCAVALGRVRLQARTRTVADTLQRALLPVALPCVPGFTISATYMPATAGLNVGGDWYDAFLLVDGRLVVTVGDVVGHGLEAAGTMGHLRQALRIAAHETGEPAAALTVIDRALRWSTPEPRMATALCGILDPVSLEFVYASAGHPAPVFAGASVELLPGGDPPLGVGTGRFRDQRTVLTPGSRLALYTDGLVEQQRDVMTGTAALLTAMHGVAATSADPAVAIVWTLMGGVAPRDDVAVLVLAVVGVGDRLEATLPLGPTLLQSTRLAFERTARCIGVGERQRALLQVVLGELLTNVVEHAYDAAGGDVTVRVYPENGTVVIQVEDRGRWRPLRADGHGLGLRIVRALAQRLDIVQGPTGTRVTFIAPIERAETEATLPVGPDESEAALTPGTV